MMLQIEGSRYGTSESWRSGSNLIDALPYSDHITERERQAAEQLILEECKNSTKTVEEYLAEFPPLPPTVLEVSSVLALSNSSMLNFHYNLQVMRVY